MWQLTVEHVQIETHSQQDTTADALDPVSTIAGSLGGSIGTISQGIDDPPIYDTDHTDLNSQSDFDEAELKRDLLKDVSQRSDLYQRSLINSLLSLQKWKQLFDSVSPIT